MTAINGYTGALNPSWYLRNGRTSVPLLITCGTVAKDMEPVSAGHVAPLLSTCGAHVPCSDLVVLAECPATLPLLLRLRQWDAGHGAVVPGGEQETIMPLMWLTPAEMAA